MTQQSNSYNTFDESKWWFDYKEEKQSDYSYWYTSEKIDAQVALRNLPASNSVKWWKFTRTSWSTWNQSITWVWFTPSFIEFKVIYVNWWQWSVSEWIWSTSSNDYCNYSYETTWTDYLWEATSNELFYVRNAAWSSVARWWIVSMDSDWFTINWYLCQMTVECVWKAYP